MPDGVGVAVAPYARVRSLLAKAHPGWVAVITEEVE